MDERPLDEGYLDAPDDLNDLTRFEDYEMVGFVDALPEEFTGHKVGEVLRDYCWRKNYHNDPDCRCVHCRGVCTCSENDRDDPLSS